MKTSDFSKEIYESYFGIKREMLVLTLKNKTVLKGKLSGFFRGEEKFGEPYIIMWRFVTEDELNELDFLPYPNQEIGFLIKQKDIEAIRFK